MMAVTAADVKTSTTSTIPLSKQTVMNHSGIEEKLACDIDNQLAFDDLAWTVMIFEFTSFEVFHPLCFGVLVTAADVVTTCSCVTLVHESSFLMVKPKSSIVEWDENYKLVMQTLLHPHCDTCGLTTSYNDVAILTIEAMTIMRGYVEPFSKSLLIPVRKLLLEKEHQNCIILGLSTGFRTPLYGTLEIVKIKFTIWPTSPATNELGTVPIFGSSVNENGSFSFSTRFPGSPLLCWLENYGYVPLGIYLGLYCPSWLKPVTPESLKKNCTNQTLIYCEDCIPRSVHPVPRVIGCMNSSHYEIALNLSSLETWITNNIFAPFQINDIFRFRTARSSTIPWFSLKALLTILSLTTAF